MCQEQSLSLNRCRQAPIRAKADTLPTAGRRIGPRWRANRAPIRTGMERAPSRPAPFKLSAIHSGQSDKLRGLGRQPQLCEVRSDDQSCTSVLFRPTTPCFCLVHESSIRPDFGHEHLRPGFRNHSHSLFGARIAAALTRFWTKTWLPALAPDTVVFW